MRVERSGLPQRHSTEHRNTWNARIQARHDAAKFYMANEGVKFQACAFPRRPNN